ncbi:hypothetical protein Bpfe_024958 [Biomphalaria pfeifferi]|uniref:Uncharacterized protein n=1 Tax=Biomphalaria pfeifferi TaxID=112525 RepID=A0AAD8B164_BIOPF|nr:hypothetical protein Bpfe_024958 [Biomphalaria pfeifferi]
MALWSISARQHCVTHGPVVNQCQTALCHTWPCGQPVPDSTVSHMALWSISARQHCVTHGPVVHQCQTTLCHTWPCGPSVPDSTVSHMTLWSGGTDLVHIIMGVFESRLKLHAL